jgi:hypothetical protein
MAVRSARRPRHSVVPVGAEGRPHAVHLGLVPALASLLGDGELPVHSRERGINFTRAPRPPRPACRALGQNAEHSSRAIGSFPRALAPPHRRPGTSPSHEGTCPAPAKVADRAHAPAPEGAPQATLRRRVHVGRPPKRTRLRSSERARRRSRRSARFRSFARRQRTPTPIEQEQGDSWSARGRRK